MGREVHLLTTKQTTMEKQTAVQWAINEIAVKWHYIESGEVLLSEIMDKAMAMEQGQIEDAHHCGRTFENKYPESNKTYNESAERYYNETYGK